MVVEDAGKRQWILESVHNTNHPGINRTLDLVSSKYYWPGLTNNVKVYVSYNNSHWNGKGRGETYVQVHGAEGVDA